METFVINMDQNTERLEHFDQMMKSLSLPYTRFPAVDGKTVAPEEKRKYFTSFSWLRKSEVGCGLSHLRLWEKLVKEDKECFLIFEDDARTHVSGETLKQLLQDFDKNVKEKPDILYLGKSLDKCDLYEHVHGKVYKSQHPLCLHAYIITKVGALKLLNLAPYSTAIDLVPVRASEKEIVNLMVFHPSLFFQDILSETSNLRSLRSALNNTSECLVRHQFVPKDDWCLVVPFIVLLVLAVIVSLIYSL